MADTNGSLSSIPSQNGPTRDAPIVSVSDKKFSPIPPNFYEWPTMESPLPADFITVMVEHREAVPVFSFVKAGNGYSFKGALRDLGQSCTPEEEAEPAYCETVKHVHLKELGGEGCVDSVVTGDKAILTWGRGLGYTGRMPDAFSRFLAMDEGTRMYFLRHGVAMVGKELRMVDIENNIILKHKEAAKYTDGLTPEEVKKKRLGIFIAGTRAYAANAATAQWESTKAEYVTKEKGTILKYLAAGWKKEAIGYAIHCRYWGNGLASITPFEDTGGSLVKLLLKIITISGYVTTAELPDKRGSYRLVPASMKGNYPAGTMLLNMGAEIMLGFLHGYKTKTQMESAAQPGDTVFDISTSGRSMKYYVLRSGSNGEPVNNKFRVFIEEHHYLEMSHLLKVLKGMKYIDVKDRREWYATKDNETRRNFGPRIMVAMDAVLHKNEGEPARWVLDQARYAGISETSCWDQFDMIKTTVGL